MIYAQTINGTILAAQKNYLVQAQILNHLRIRYPFCEQETYMMKTHILYSIFKLF